MREIFYITTAIDYPNGAPHMGHAYEKVVADTYARWARFLGQDVFFLTGTDENGQKLVKAAQVENKSTAAYVDEQVAHFKKLCVDLEISQDDFIRTTEPRHHRCAQDLWKVLESKGDIYFGEYDGHYCLACEAFYTELQAPDGKCPVHGTALERMKEKGFFFRLSAYASWIREYIEKTPGFVVPESAKKEMLNRIDKEPVKDLSVSRPNAGWGIPVPGHEDFVMYTWFDALINYYSAHYKTERAHYWPATMHVIGKDITWFHTVIWPCLLKAAGVALPKQVYVHGMVLGQDGRKMSKSLNNGVDPLTVIQRFPVESFRYYLLRAIPSGLDGAFVTEDLRKRHNSELANDYGNLLMRVVKLAMKKVGPEFTNKSYSPVFNWTRLGSSMAECMQAREHHRALDALWAAINEVNLYLNDKAPWKMQGTDPAFSEVIYHSLYSLHCFGSLLQAFMPKVSEATLKSLGTQARGLKGLEFGVQSFHLEEPPILFAKIEAAPA